MEPTRPKRSYTSSRRQQQAAETRLSILEAARALFAERGYSSTTIEAIAQAAGVAPETVYAAFGNKVTLLQRLVETTLVGDEEPIPLAERPFVRAALAETDQAALVRHFAADMHAIMTRMSPLFAVLNAAAPADAKIAALRAQVLARRREGMGIFVERLGQLGSLRRGAATADPVATVWAVSSAEVFHLLTHDLGWSEARYVEWLSDVLARALLPEEVR